MTTHRPAEGPKAAKNLRSSEPRRKPAMIMANWMRIYVSSQAKLKERKTMDGPETFGSGIFFWKISEGIENWQYVLLFTKKKIEGFSVKLPLKYPLNVDCQDPGN